MVFKFYIDERVAVWRRSYTIVKADTLKEALQQCIDETCDITDSEILYETEEVLNPDNEATFEVYDEQDNLLYSNAQKLNDK